jgi:hypothetical protein
MLKLWIRVGVLAAGLAAVILAQMYLKDLAGLNYPDAPVSGERRSLEVETQAAGAAGTADDSGKATF